MELRIAVHKFHLSARFLSAFECLETTSKGEGSAVSVRSKQALVRET